MARRLVQFAEEDPQEPEHMEPRRYSRASRPRGQSARDQGPAEAQHKAVPADPQAESTQQGEAEASRVKQQPTRETGGAHSPATRMAQRKADANKHARHRGATQAFSFYSSAAKAAFRPAVPPGQRQKPAVPKKAPAAAAKRLRNELA